VGLLDWSYPHFGYRLGAEDEDLTYDERDNAAEALKCRVVDTWPSVTGSHFLYQLLWECEYRF
jgi:hypothetical protein